MTTGHCVCGRTGHIGNAAGCFDAPTGRTADTHILTARKGGSHDITDPLPQNGI